MGKIANIYTTTIFKNDLYNVVTNIDDVVDTLPTLIIGWQNVKKLYPDADILDWKINDMVYWTFGKRERRSEYDKRIQMFDDFVVNNLIKTVDYVFINLLSCQINTKRDIFKILSNDEQKSVLKYGNMLYFSTIYDNVVYGINLLDILYQGKSIASFLNLIKSNKSSLFVECDSYDSCNEIVSKFKGKEYLATKLFV